jgi:hypothetical protein
MEGNFKEKAINHLKSIDEKVMKLQDENISLQSKLS